MPLAAIRMELIKKTPGEKKIKKKKKTKKMTKKMKKKMKTSEILWLLGWFLLLAASSAESSAANPSERAPIAMPQKRARRHIRLVTVESPPFMMKRRELSERPAKLLEKLEKSEAGAQNGSAEWFGYCVDFFQELVKHLPYELTYEIREVADGMFGSKKRQLLEEQVNRSGKLERHFRRLETWNGLVGELKAQRAELALAPMAVMAERELEVDFTVPFYDLVGIQILLKRPEVPQNWFKFLTVLDGDVWLSIGLAYFVTSFVIYIFDRLSPYSNKNLARIRRVRARSAAEQRKGRRLIGATGGGVAPLQRGAPVAETGNFYLTRGLAISATQAGELNGLETKLAGALAGRHEQAQHLGSLEAAAAEPKPLGLGAGAGGGGGGGRRRASREYLTGLRTRLRPRLHSLTNSAERNHSNSNSNSDSDSDAPDDGRPDFNLRDSLWFCITSLTPQGGGEAPQNLSGRLVAGAWWLFCFIVIASYTANLAAFLTVSRLDIPIESLDELAKQYRIKYAPIDGSAEQTYFERMAYIEEIFYNIWKEMSLNESLSEQERSKFSVWDYPISDRYTKIWAQIQEVGMPNSLGAALARVRNSSLDDGFALLADANSIKYALMTDCSLKAVGEEFSRKPVALALAKGREQLRDDLSYAILQLINKRFMEVLREKWWTNNPARVVCDSKDESEGISIENIGGVFIIILAGILLSFFVWAIERLLYRTKVDVSRALAAVDERVAATATAGPT